MSDIIPFEEDEELSREFEVVEYQPTLNVEEKLAELIETHKNIEPAKLDNLYEQTMFELVKAMPTPLEVIKTRVGADGREYEYFPEYYTQRQLDILFPGWWCDEMKTWYDASTQAYITTGYLCVSYTLPSGQTKIRRVYAVGGAKVHSTKASRETGVLEASQPEDRAIASYTRWKKLAGKQLGIGLDIYHQQITPYLRKKLEDTIYPIWESYAKKIRDLAKTITTGKGMRKLIMSLGTREQYETISILLLKLKGLLEEDKYQKLSSDVWNLAISDKDKIPEIIKNLNIILNKKNKES